MIRGRVSPGQDDDRALEARISISIAGANWTFQALEVVVDTGFTGALALPEPIIRSLGLESYVRRDVTLADGRTIRTAAYTTRLLWHGQPVDVWVPMMDSAPMIGTDLLAGSRLSIDWWDGGDVIIEERIPSVE